MTDHLRQIADDVEALGEIPERLSASDLQSICDSYCIENDTMSEIEAEWDLAHQEMISIRQAFRLRHDEPVILFEADEEVASDYVASVQKRHSIERKAKQKARREERKAARQWWQLEDTLKEAANRFSTPDLSTPPERLDAEGEPAALVCNIQDLHIGAQRARGGATLEAQITRVEEGFERLLSRSRAASATEKIFIVTGADMLHCDSAGGTTTKGTQLETCAPTPEILEASISLLVSLIEKARQVAKEVELVFAAGNHDRVLGYSAYLAACRFYTGADDVVAKEGSRDRQYRTWKQHAVMVTHGDMSKRMLKRLPQIALSEARQTIGSARWVSVFTGHLHTEEVSVDRAGFKTFRCATSKPADAYEDQRGYVAGREGLQGVLLFEGGDDITISTRTGE